MRYNSFPQYNLCNAENCHLQSGCPVFSDPRIIEPTFVCVGQDFNSSDYLNCEVAHNITALKKHNVEHDKAIAALQDNFHALSVKFNTLKNDFDHLMEEHLAPVQASISSFLYASPFHPCVCHLHQVHRFGNYNRDFPGHPLSQSIILRELISSQPISGIQFFSRASPESESPSPPSSIPSLISKSSKGSFQTCTSISDVHPFIKVSTDSD